jgi:hypothetical protein
MSKMSMKQAAKIFMVSRPTLAKHREQGKISGEKIGDTWQFDVSELARVYRRRGDKPAPSEHVDLPPTGTPAAPDLEAEIRVLRAQLEAEKQARELTERHLDDLRRLLPPPRRGWWPWNKSGK